MDALAERDLIDEMTIDPIDAPRVTTHNEKDHPGSPPSYADRLRSLYTDWMYAPQKPKARELRCPQPKCRGKLENVGEDRPDFFEKDGTDSIVYRCTRCNTMCRQR